MYFLWLKRLASSANTIEKYEVQDHYAIRKVVQEWNPGKLHIVQF